MARPTSKQKQIFEVYKTAIGLELIPVFGERKKFRFPNGEERNLEWIMGSAEFAGFMDGYMGNSNKYEPARGSLSPARDGPEGLHVNISRESAPYFREYAEKMGGEAAELINSTLDSDRTVRYSKGYDIGIQYRGVRAVGGAQRTESDSLPQGSGGNLIQVDFRKRD